MKTLLVDDNQLSLDILHEICAASLFAENVGEFTDPMEALDFVGKNPADFALLDVEMPKMSGIDLGEKFRVLYPKIVLIYVTGHEDAYIDAMRMKADFYVCKPFDREDILEAIDRAQLLSARPFKQTMIRTFGRFDVFVAATLIHFLNAKSKELLALCVDRRGSGVTMEEAIGLLWPDTPYDEKAKRRYRKAIMMLHHTLNMHGIPDIFVSKRGQCYIRPEKILCDYYNYLKNPGEQPPEEYMVLTSETSIVSRWMLASLRPMPSSWWKIPVSGSIGFFMIILLMMVAREKKTCPDYFSKGNLSGFPERPRRLAISSYPVAQARYRDCRP